MLFLYVEIICEYCKYEYKSQQIWCRFSNLVRDFRPIRVDKQLENKEWKLGRATNREPRTFPPNSVPNTQTTRASALMNHHAQVTFTFYVILLTWPRWLNNGPNSTRRRVQIFLLRISIYAGTVKNLINFNRLQYTSGKLKLIDLYFM